MVSKTPMDSFLDEILRLQDVQISNERSLMVNGREFLHIHGNTTLHILLPKDVKSEVLANGRAQQHPFAPKSGMIALYLKTELHLADALKLANISYGYMNSKVRKRGNPRSQDLIYPVSQKGG